MHNVFTHTRTVLIDFFYHVPVVSIGTIGKVMMTMKKKSESVTNLVFHVEDIE